MKFDKRLLRIEADKLGYTRDTYEKVVRLVDVLAYIRYTNVLFDNLALKGGTAINLTIFDLPRLSVDIDLDFILNTSKEEMLVLRGEIKILLFDYMDKNDYKLGASSRLHYSLDSFTFNYINAGGNNDAIKVEINYSLRSHIYTPVITTSNDYGLIRGVEIKTIHPYEIFGSKLIALMTRATPRDLFDIMNMINSKLFCEDEFEKVRKCAVFYRAISNEDANFDFDIKRIHEITQSQIKRYLFPVITRKERFDLNSARAEIELFFNNNLSLNDNERKFLREFEMKNYIPELLFDEIDIIDRIKNHPMALWKMIVEYKREEA